MKNKMAILDALNKEINLGLSVRYTGTGTIGTVADFKEENGKSWVKLEDSDLWYSNKSIEVIQDQDKEEKHGLDTDELIQSIKDQNEIIGSHNADDDVCGGGG